MEQKGTAIRSTLRAVESLYGSEALAKVKQELPRDVREQLEPSVLVVRWYPIRVAAEIHAAIRDVCGHGSWDASHKLGREAARNDFTGIYRLVLRAVQYDTIWERMELAWRGLVSSGSFDWYERREGYIRTHITGVSGFNRGIWNAAAGRGERLLEMTGAKSASVQVVDASSVDCTLEGMWLV